MQPQSAPEATQNPPQPPTKRVRKVVEPWSPPRGIRYVHRPDRPSAFQLVWTEDGQERKQSFKDVGSREQVAKALVEKREKHGSSILSFNPQRWRVFEQFTEIVGANTDPLQVAREWKEARGAGSAAVPTLTVGDAVERYLTLRDTEGGVDANYLAHVQMHLRKSFVPRLGHVKLHELTADHIRGWLAGLSSGRVRKGYDGTLGVEARKHYYRSIHAFLSRATSEQWVTRNVCEIVAMPAPTPAELAASDVIKLMPVADVEKLFRANRDNPVVGRLALEAFGGVRYTTAGKMTADLIDFDRKGLAMPGAIHKSRRRKFRQGHPAALWAWLEHVKTNLADCWVMTPREYYTQKHDAFVRAGVRNPHNGLRHSFASYLLADTKDLPRVSYLMQHAKTTMTERYEGRASEADAKRYLAIVP